jgi:type VI secretion system protein ImpM
MQLNGKIGFYGKLPSLGDFVSRRLPNEFIAIWDDWLQDSIAFSREELGSNWLSYYLNSPIWRFALNKGVCGNSVWVGILMPSVDKVGRYFPITIAMPIEETQLFSQLLITHNDWFEQLETIALKALQNNITVVEFDSLIQEIPSFQISQSTDSKLKEQKAFSFVVDNSNKSLNSSSILTDCLLNTFIPNYSLWTTDGLHEMKSILSVFEALPPVKLFSHFLKRSKEDSEKTAEIDLLPFLEPPELKQNSIKTWRSWSVTDKGKVRKYNQDSVLDNSEMSLWVVADGMGGHKAGDVASQLIVNSLQKLSLTSSLESRLNDVKTCLKNVNTELRDFAAKECDGDIVGSTVVALLNDKKQCAFVWAGDCRLYRLRNNALQQLTKDHCQEDEDITQPVAQWKTKKSNVITRAVGAYKELELDSNIIDVHENDIFLLCSDGLDKELSFNEIQTVMTTNKTEEIMNILFEKTLARGSRDNVSIIIVEAKNIN